jgi:cation:H+ antiporter
MPPVVIVIAEFAICASVIVFAGVRLSRYGDVIAEKSGAGGTWVGLTLLAAVTSLPELVSGASGILLFDVPDIAVGNALGACLFDLLILALLDAMHPVPLSARIHQGHVLAAGFAVINLGVVAASFIAGPRAPSFGWIGLSSAGLVALYGLAIRTILRFERLRLEARLDQIAEELRHRDLPLSRALWLFVLNAVLLVLAATLLPGLAERLADVADLSESFVGSLFMAVSTSLPEVVVSVTAVRLGAIDMAAANLFGSILFNSTLLAFDDLLYLDGPLGSAVSTSHVTTIVGAIIMTGIAIVGFTVRARVKRYRLSWDAIGMVTVYVLTLTLLAT